MNAADIVSIISAVGAAVAAVFGYLNTRKLTKVHTAVNGNAQEQIARVDQLTEALTEASIKVPPRPPEPPEPPKP